MAPNSTEKNDEEPDGEEEKEGGLTEGDDAVNSRERLSAAAALTPVRRRTSRQIEPVRPTTAQSVIVKPDRKTQAMKKRKHPPVERSRSTHSNDESEAVDGTATGAATRKPGKAQYNDGGEAKDQPWRASCADGFAALLERYPCQLKHAPRVDVSVAEMWLSADSGASAVTVDATPPCAMVVHGLPSPNSFCAASLHHELTAALVDPAVRKVVLQQLRAPKHDGSVDVRVRQHSSSKQQCHAMNRASPIAHAFVGWL